MFQEFSSHRRYQFSWRSFKAGCSLPRWFEALSKASLRISSPIPTVATTWVTHAVGGRLRGKEPEAPTPYRRPWQSCDGSREVRQPPGNSGIVEIQAEASQHRSPGHRQHLHRWSAARTRSFNVDDAKSTREYLSQQTNQVSDALTRSEAALPRSRCPVWVQSREKSMETTQRLSQLETTR